MRNILMSKKFKKKEIEDREKIVKDKKRAYRKKKK
jgi:hypothetical protein